MTEPTAEQVNAAAVMLDTWLAELGITMVAVHANMLASRIATALARVRIEAHDTGFTEAVRGYLKTC